MNDAPPMGNPGKYIPELPRIQRAVYKLLQRGGKLSAGDISVALHLSDPRGHIRNLRDKGICILDEWQKSEYGTRYKLYYLPFH